MGRNLANMAGLTAQSIGELADGTLRPEESLDSVWLHIALALDRFAQSAGDSPRPTNETGLTQQLLTLIDRQAGYRPYFFRQEYMENEYNGNSRRVDVAVQARDDANFVVHGVRYSNGSRFLALEAKLLPTPGTGRKREYVLGNQGGVERYKRGHHALEPKTVGILGYIRRGTFDHWQAEINGWINELIEAPQSGLPWDELDSLSLVESFPHRATLHSNNLRVTDNTRLTMRHLWVRV